MQAILVAAIAAVGVDVGWQSTENGETEYIIQIEPHQLKTLKPGDKLDVGVRPQLRNISSFQIVVGDAELPRIERSPKLSLASPDDRPDPSQAATSFLAKRYPEQQPAADAESLDPSAPSVLRSTSDPPRPTSNTGWIGHPTPLVCPPGSFSDHLPPTSAEQASPITHQPPSAGLEHNPLQPGPQSIKNWQAIKAGGADHLPPTSAEQASPITRQPPSAGLEHNPLQPRPQSMKNWQAIEAGGTDHRPPASAEQASPITHQPPSAGLKHNPLQPRLHSRRNLQAIEAGGAEPDLQAPVGGDQRGPIDSNNVVVPPAAAVASPSAESALPPSPQVSDAATEQDTGLTGPGESLPSESLATDGDPAAAEQPTTAPRFAAAADEGPTQENPATTPGKATVGPRYAELEPTLPRSLAETDKQPPHQPLVLPRVLTPDPADSLEEVRREMARSLEKRASPWPPASNEAVPAFPVEPPSDPGVAGETARQTAAPAAGNPAGPATADPPTSPTSGPSPSGDVPPEVAPPTWLPLALGSSRPHLFLTLSLLALFASLGGNLYLGWITLDLRRRFHHFARTHGVRS
ncbi:MAG: hypothetical protein GTO53_11265 [Planctomycetales bacterium]|nr:hypothetical protein [Planctomycetales bacterium]NIM09695.1 hypothetical protein [Planctomycetales bacterium]NIN09172.1 hypothetical protein [Planctomycetales bacterium]NIN78277.1 hypothetical protein [Planctomycetales bacterium]NIO35468.1 hypothetical protein [Planctomycetales bacterium]